MGNCLAWAFNIFFISLLEISASPRANKLSIWGRVGARSRGHGTLGEDRSFAFQESWVRKRAQGGMLWEERRKIFNDLTQTEDRTSSLCRAACMGALEESEGSMLYLTYLEDEF